MVEAVSLMVLEQSLLLIPGHVGLTTMHCHNWMDFGVYSYIYPWNLGGLCYHLPNLAGKYQFHNSDMNCHAPDMDDGYILR